MCGNILDSEYNVYNRCEIQRLQSVWKIRTSHVDHRSMHKILSENNTLMSAIDRVDHKTFRPSSRESDDSKVIDYQC